MAIFIALILSTAGVVAALLTGTVLFAPIALGVALLGLIALGWQIATEWPKRSADSSDDSEAAEDEAPSETTVSDEPEETAVVHLIPGRRRFHYEGCPLLDGHDHETVTLVEAREEGFSECSTCAPAVPVVGSQAGRPG